MNLAPRRWLTPHRLLIFAAVAAVTLVYVYPLTLSTPLLDPDEGLHASIAQEMVERSDYLVPRFCGEPFRDKPIVYFAAQALSLRLFGMNEAALRLPGMSFSLLGCFTTWLLARRLYDQEVALYALVAALTLVLPVMLTQSPAHDIALVPAINLLAICFWELERATTGRMQCCWLASGAACVALALLTKGLIGIAVFAVGIGLFAVVTRNVSWRFVGQSAFVLGSGAALASPWFIAMELASPGYLKYYFVERHLLGFVTAGQTHGEAPWYYYAAPVLGGAMPWLLYSVAAVMQLAVDAKRTKESRATILMVCWFVGGFLFLSTANSKLMTYSLPLFPPVAVLAGVAFGRFFRGTLSPTVEWIMANSFRGACVLGTLGPVVTLIVFNNFLGAPSSTTAFVLAAIAGMLITAALVIFERGARRMGFALGILWFPLLFVALIQGPFPEFAEKHSQRALAREISKCRPRPEQVIMVGEETGSLMFYLSPDDRTWFREDRVEETNGKIMDRLATLPPGWVVAITDKELSRTLHAEEMRRRAPTLAGNFRIITAAGTRIAEGPIGETSFR